MKRIVCACIACQSGMQSELFPQHRSFEWMFPISGETVPESSDLLIPSGIPFIDLIYLPFLKKKPKIYFSSCDREHEYNSVEYALYHSTSKHRVKEVVSWYYWCA